jgi:hypothetical protein
VESSRTNKKKTKKYLFLLFLLRVKSPCCGATGRVAKGQQPPYVGVEKLNPVNPKNKGGVIIVPAIQQKRNGV